MGSIGVLPLVHDLLVRGLHLLEHFFRLFLVGIVDISIRVILLAQIPVCFLDLIV